MKISDAKKRGMYELKIEIGSYFLEKKREDFDTDTDWDLYKNSKEAEEFVTFREPRGDELTGMNMGSIPANMFGGVEGKILLEAMSMLQNQDKKQIEKSQALIKGCMIDHSFTDDNEKKESVAVVWKEIIMPRQKLMTEIFKIFFENMTLKKTNS